MNNKKGISDVVTTVLIVLLSLVAVAIVWSFLSPLITKSGTQISQTQACLSASLEVVGCKLAAAGTTNYNVTVHNAGSTDLTIINLIFAKGDGSTKAINDTTPLKKLETNLYPALPVGYVATTVAVSAGIVDAKGVVSYCTPSQPVTC